jgi:hypothetical protein
MATQAHVGCGEVRTASLEARGPEISREPSWGETDFFDLVGGGARPPCGPRAVGIRNLWRAGSCAVVWARDRCGSFLTASYGLFLRDLAFVQGRVKGRPRWMCGGVCEAVRLGGGLRSRRWRFTGGFLGRVRCRMG